MEKETHRRPISGPVLVIGSGLMGSGIAQVIATAGYHVRLTDVSRKALDIAQTRIADSLSRLVASGRMESDIPETALERIEFDEYAPSALNEVDLVLESVVEDLEVKREIFQDLDARTGSEVLLATNTSQFPIGKIAGGASSPERIIGMHWSNPPPLMPLVEVIPSAKTSDEAFNQCIDFVHSCGHRTVVCRKDVPGFISTRLYQALVLEAMRIVDDGLASAEEVDDVARYMHGHKMGPLAALDFAGLDTALSVSKELADHYGPRFLASPVLSRLVDAGHTGRKSGRGFYTYE